MVGKRAQARMVMSIGGVELPVKAERMLVDVSGAPERGIGGALAAQLPGRP